MRTKRANSSLPGHNHERCIDQICTCHRPEHRCPVNFHREGKTPASNYQADFVAHSPAKAPPKHRPLDNLRTGDAFFGNTVYQQEFRAPQRPDLLAQTADNQKRYQDTFANHNLKSHIKDLVRPGPKEAARPLAAQTEGFTKPSGWVRPKDRVLANAPMQAQTEYSRGFRRPDADNAYNATNNTLAQANNVRLHGNNLRTFPDPVYHPESAYRQAHGSKSPSNNKQQTNDRLYQINKLNNQTTAVLNNHENFGKQTEYGRNFQPLPTTRVKQCSLFNMPTVPADLMNKPNHVAYDGYNKTWKLQQQ